MSAALDIPGAHSLAAAGLAGAATDQARVLFVNHAGRIAGAELILLDVARGSEGRPLGSVFLFEDGPMRRALDTTGVTAIVSKRAGDLGRVKRDQSLLRALPMMLRLVGTGIEVAIAARRHELVYANSQKAFVVASIAAFVARRKLVWHLHDILSAAHFGSAQRRLVTFLANRFSDRVIVPSQAAADAFVGAGGRADRVRVVANGLDLPDAVASRRLDSAARDAARIEAGLPAGFLFGVFSRLAPWKGQHIALQALASMPDARLAIVGDALFGEDAYAARLRQDAAALGVMGRVTFLGHRGDVPALMQLCDAVVHPSVDAEPFGRTLVEAMLCRVPVVAARTGAVPDILDEGRAGVMVPAGDAPALAAALVRLRDHPQAAAGMIDAAHGRALGVYSRSRMVAAIDRVVADLVAQPPR